jgi:hypothetical protein
MRNNTVFEFENISLSRTTGSELRGRQSIRATFRLSSSCIDAISIVAKHLGIKQKSLFDHLAEDTKALTAIAQEIRDYHLRPEDRIQKTFVISRRSLHSIESISRDFNAPRDVLVEFSIQRLLPIIASERGKHEKRKAILEQLRNHLSAGQEIQEYVSTSLGKDDPLYHWVSTAMNYYQNAVAQVSEFIDRGKLIEAFDPDSFGQLNEKE